MTTSPRLAMMKPFTARVLSFGIVTFFYLTVSALFLGGSFLFIRLFIRFTDALMK